MPRYILCTKAAAAEAKLKELDALAGAPDISKRLERYSVAVKHTTDDTYLITIPDWDVERFQGVAMLKTKPEGFDLSGEGKAQTVLKTAPAGWPARRPWESDASVTIPVQKERFSPALVAAQQALGAGLNLACSGFNWDAKPWCKESPEAFDGYCNDNYSRDHLGQYAAAWVKHVRLCLAPHYMSDKGVINKQALINLVRFADRVLDAGLLLNVDMHATKYPVDGLLNITEFAAGRGLDLYTQLLVDTFRPFAGDRRVYLEVMNEPEFNDPRDYNVWLRSAVPAIRKVCPDNVLIIQAHNRWWTDCYATRVVGGKKVGKFGTGLAQMEVPDDNYLKGFTTYFPSIFCDQGRNDDFNRPNAGLPYPIRNKAHADAVAARYPLPNTAIRSGWKQSYCGPVGGGGTWHDTGAFIGPDTIWYALGSHIDYAGGWPTYVAEFGMRREVTDAASEVAYVRDFATLAKAAKVPYALFCMGKSAEYGFGGVGRTVALRDDIAAVLC